MEIEEALRALRKIKIILSEHKIEGRSVTPELATTTACSVAVFAIERIDQMVITRRIVKEEIEKNFG